MKSGVRGEIEYEDFGVAAVVEYEAGLAGESRGIAGLQRLAIDAGSPTHEVHIGQALRIQRQFGALVTIEQAGEN